MKSMMIVQWKDKLVGVQICIRIPQLIADDRVDCTSEIVPFVRVAGINSVGWLVISLGTAFLLQEQASNTDHSLFSSQRSKRTCSSRNYKYVVHVPFRCESTRHLYAVFHEDM